MNGRDRRPPPKGTPPRGRGVALPSHEKFSGERVERALESLRQEDAYAEAEGCEACAATRRESGDETALCERHLARILSF